MQIVKINPNKPGLKTLKRAVKVLKKGGVVVCPTDTVYLMAADATNPNAIKSIFAIKGRKTNKPVHVVVNDVKMGKEYVEFNDVAQKLARKFLPGPLTLVLRKRIALPNILTSGGRKLGIRIPSLKLNVLLAEKLGKPYTATSANKSGGADPYDVNSVLSQLSAEEIGLIDLILDGGQLDSRKPSTLVDCTVKPPKIIRPGPITKEIIEKALGING
jgi:L-threonylcarbamoyladenylate synthase